MNKFEEIKATRDGLDVWPDIERYAREGWEAITDDDKARMKWYGLFFRKHTPGYFMLRIRMPNGLATAEQAETIADIAAEFGRGEMDITTRQQIQVRWFRIEHVPEMFRRLKKVDLDTRQTGMDNVRNIVGCPLAGISAHELLDASPVVHELTSFIVGNREFTNLPRKFNVTITGCTDNCVHLESQDIALGPARKYMTERQVSGFNVMVGGKMGSGGFTAARSLDVFVTAQEAAGVCAEITRIFRDHGPRDARGRARLAFLIDDWGTDRFRDELEAHLGRPLERAGRDVRQTSHQDHIGVVPQSERGRYSVGLAVPVGRLTSSQFRQAAALSREYGRGELRLSPGQNLILTHVPDTRLRALLDEPLLETLRPDPSPAMRGTVACIGIGLCDLAMTDTKGDALAVAQRLEWSSQLRRPIAINWSGCPAGCGNHHIADIGLQGGKARVGDEVVEVYQVFAGGRAGAAARAAEPALAAVPASEIGDVVERLARAHSLGRDLVEAGREIAAELGQEVEERAETVA